MDDCGRVICPETGSKVQSAGPDRWRMRCPEPRCRMDRPVGGATLADRWARAERAGTVRTFERPTKFGRPRSYADGTITPGDYVWAQSAGPHRVLVTIRRLTLTLGADL